MFGMFEAKHGLIFHSAAPLNAEPPLDWLRAAFITATEDFYARSHGALPDPDAETHAVRVKGRVRTAIDLTRADLMRRFAPGTVTVALQCAGNRRADMQQVEATTGDPWAAGAIGNADWTGAALADVLRAAGADEGENLHVPRSPPLHARVEF